MKKINNGILQAMVENDIGNEDHNKEAVEASEQQEKIKYKKFVWKSC